VAHLRIAAAQLDTVVGDLKGNIDRVRRALERAEAANADLLVVPELAITGYPPEDLLLKPGFLFDTASALGELARATADCAVVVGFVEPLEDGSRSGADDRAGALPPVPIANAAAVCAGGTVFGTYHKRLLPNYGVFDEQRWFVPGRQMQALYRIGGVVVGISICEDIWATAGPALELAQSGAELIVNLNASPYSRGRREERLAMLRRRTAETGCPIVYVNQVGGQDELVFDGASLVLSADGELLAAGKQFEEDLVIVDVSVGRGHKNSSVPSAELGRRPVPQVVPVTAAPRDAGRWRPSPLPPVLSLEAEVYAALVLGTRDYLEKNGFSEVLVGISGGVDSSLVATIATDAVGASRVHAVSMPSRYSSPGSRSDAKELAARLGIDLWEVPIEAAHVALASMLRPVLGSEPTGLTDENLQSRIRGVVLMALSNATGWIVLTTGNKSEMATGYSTLYGDSAGGFAVIKDVPKTLVYELCRYRNAIEREPLMPIPESVLKKPPSAELRPDQRDDQTLPPYEVLDPVLAAYVEQDLTPPEMVAAGFDPDVVASVVALVDAAEYKRRQMPPGVRVTTKAFGKDRRMPITNRYH